MHHTSGSRVRDVNIAVVGLELWGLRGVEWGVGSSGCSVGVCITFARFEGSGYLGRKPSVDICI